MSQPTITVFSPPAATAMLVTVAVLAACATEAPETTSRVGMSIAGASVVENARARWSESEAWSVAGLPRVEVGALEGDEAHEFSEISSAAVLPDRRLVVADGGTSTVRLYNPDGAHSTTLGSAGSGPGEFRSPRQVAVDSVGTIRVWDEALWRITTFDARGELVDVRTADPARLSERVADPPLYASSATLLYDEGLLVRLEEKTKATSAAGLFRRPSGAIRVSADLRPLGAHIGFLGPERATLDSPWGRIEVDPPAAKSTLIAAHPSAPGFCLAERERPEVWCVAADGSAVKVSWPGSGTRTAPSADEIGKWRAETLELYEPKLSADDTRRLLDAVPVPEGRPPFDQLVVDIAGHVWVGGSAARDESRDDFLVFAPDGQMLGTVHVPRGRLVSIGLDHVVVVTEDALGVQRVGVFALDRTPSE